MRLFTFKQWIHASTALSLMIHQIPPAFAMERNAEDKEEKEHFTTYPKAHSCQSSPNDSNYNNKTNNARLAKSDLFSKKNALALPKNLEVSQSFLQELILKTTKTRQDSVSPLVQEIRQDLHKASEEIKRVIINELRELLEESTSLLPIRFLRLKEGTFLEDQITCEHISFKRINELISSLKKIQESQFITSHPLREKLKTLEDQYQLYIDFLCTKPPQERLHFLSAIPLITEFSSFPYLVSEEMAYHLLSIDGYGLIHKNNTTGSSAVSTIGKSICIKKNRLLTRGNPESLNQETVKGTLQPAMEWAMSAFHYLLFGEGLVSSSLLILPQVPYKKPLSGSRAEKLIQDANDPNISSRDRDKIINRLHEDQNLKNQFEEAKKPYITQVTPKIKGEHLGDFLHKAIINPSLFETLDKIQVQELILSLLLTQPADAKGDNFIVTFSDEPGKGKIIGIDNDWALASMIVKDDMMPNFHILETRNILFFISYFMNQQIEEKVRKKFLNYTPTQFALIWLKSLVYHNEQYQRLYEEGYINWENYALLGFPLKLKRGAGMALLERFSNLRQYLCMYPSANLEDLFKVISPLAALYHKRLLKEAADNPLKAFDIAYRGEKSFESILKGEDPLQNGKTVEQALAEENSLKDAYKDRKQDLEEAAQEVLKETNFKILSPEEKKDMLEEAASSFPYSLSSVFATSSSIFPTLHEILAVNPSTHLVRIIIEAYPISLFSRDNKGLLPLYYAIYHHASSSVLELLLLKKALPDNLEIFLELAIEKENVEAIKKLSALMDTNKAREIKVRMAEKGFSSAKQEVQKDVRAIYELGKTYETQENLAHAFEWYEKAAGKNYWDAKQAIIGLAEKGQSRALRWMEIKADNDGDLANKLGEIYENQKAFEKAFEFYAKASEKSHWKASSSIVRLARQGQSRAIDWVKIKAVNKDKDDFANVLGEIYEAQENLEYAFEWYEKAYKRNHWAAKWAIIGLAEKGFSRALKWMEAEAKGDGDLANWLGEIYEKHKDFNKSYTFYVKAIEKNQKKATFGIIRLAQQKYSPAFKWMRQYADQNADYAYEFGNIYREGKWGVPRDYIEAFKWYRRAANQNNAGAQYELGEAYELGLLGIRKNLIEAFKWYREAAERNHVKAQFKLGEAYEKGQLNIRKNDEAAFQYYKLSAEGDYAIAQFKLGEIFEKGFLNIEKDDQIAFRWYARAAEKEPLNKPHNSIAKLFLKAQNEPHDCIIKLAKRGNSSALEWMESKGQQSAQMAYELGAMYEKGLGVSRNYPKAFKWYYRADFNGYGLLVGPDLIRVGIILGAMHIRELEEGVIRELAQRWWFIPLVMAVGIVIEIADGIDRMIEKIKG